MPKRLILYFLSIFSIFEFGGCERLPDDPRAYPIRIVSVREYPDDMTNFQFIDWNHTGKQQILTGYFGLNEEAPRVRIENLNGNLFEERLSRKAFLLRNRRFFALDTVRFHWIETYFDANGDGKFEGFLQKSTPTSESLIEFDPDSSGSDKMNPGKLKTLLTLTRPDTLTKEVLWYAEIHGPYPLPRSSHGPVGWVSLDFGEFGPPTQIIFVDSVEPWKEAFRFTSGSACKYQDAIDPKANGKYEYLLACNGKSDSSFIIALDETGNTLWQTPIGSGLDKISCVVNTQSAHLFIADSVGVTNDTIRTKLIELNPVTGTVIREATFAGFVGIPQPVSNDTHQFAIWVNAQSNTVQWLDDTFQPNGLAVTIDGIESFQGVVLNTDHAIPTMYQMKLNREDSYVYLASDLNIVAYSRFRIENENTEFGFPVSIGRLPACQGIMHGKEYEFYKAFGQERYMLAYVESNPFWVLWRYRWFSIFGGGALFAYIGILFSIKFYRKRREYQIAEEQIRELSRELLSAEERERHRIGRDLHDGVAQELSAIKLNLESLRELKLQTASETNELNRVVTQLHGAISEIRNISHKLLPAGLDTLGLLVSVKSLIDDFRSESGVETTFASSGFEHFEPESDLSITAYRLIQEALHNVQRHANASLVHVSMHNDSKSILLRIEDNGIGFNVLQRRKEAVTQKRLGLFGMAERVDMFHGTIEIDSHSGKGTRIRIVLPILGNAT